VKIIVKHIGGTSLSTRTLYRAARDAALRVRGSSALASKAQTGKIAWRQRRRNGRRALMASVIISEEMKIAGGERKAASDGGKNK
jgi:hypothetical protein